MAKTRLRRVAPTAEPQSSAELKVDEPTARIAREELLKRIANEHTREHAQWSKEMHQTTAVATVRSAVRGEEPPTSRLIPCAREVSLARGRCRRGTAQNSLPVAVAAIGTS